MKINPQQTEEKTIRPQASDSQTSATNNVVREESIKVSAEKLDTVLNTSSEVYISRIRLDNDQKLLAAALEQIGQDIAGLNKEFSSEISEISSKNISVNSNSGSMAKAKVNDENTQQSIILEYQTNISMGLEKVSIHNANLQKNIEDLEVLSSRLQSGAMNFRMLPISNLFNRFPAQVRDIARQIGKKVE